MIQSNLTQLKIQSNIWSIKLYMIVGLTNRLIDYSTNSIISQDKIEGSIKIFKLNSHHCSNIEENHYGGSSIAWITDSASSIASNNFVSFLNLHFLKDLSSLTLNESRKRGPPQRYVTKSGFVKTVVRNLQKAMHTLCSCKFYCAILFTSSTMAMNIVLRSSLLILLEPSPVIFCVSDARMTCIIRSFVMRLWTHFQTFSFIGRDAYLHMKVPTMCLSWTAWILIQLAWQHRTNLCFSWTRTF